MFLKRLRKLYETATKRVVKRTNNVKKPTKPVPKFYDYNMKDNCTVKDTWKDLCTGVKYGLLCFRKRIYYYYYYYYYYVFYEKYNEFEWNLGMELRFVMGLHINMGLGEVFFRGKELFNKYK